MIAQFFWTGIPCIYYGDEAAIDGYPETDAGFRYPMPWGRFTPEGERHLEITKTMTRLRRTMPAFSKGGRMVLLAQGRVLAVARFFEDQVCVGVLSMEPEPVSVCLPLSLVGMREPAEDTDFFGSPVKGSCRAEGYEVEVPAYGSLLFACR